MIVKCPWFIASGKCQKMWDAVDRSPAEDLCEAVSVIFWKTLLKIALALAAIAMVVLLTSGVILIVQNIHHAAR